MHDFCCECGNTIDSCTCETEFRSLEEIIDDQNETIEYLEVELRIAKDEIERLKMQLNR